MMDWLFILGIVLFVVGFALIGIELFLPGIGAPGILGSICLVAGVLLTADTVKEAIIIIAIVIVLLAAFIFVIVGLLSKGKIKTPIVLNDRLDKENGYISSTDLQYLIGKKGVAATALRPAGRVSIEGVEFDCISDGRFINEGEEIEIYKISNSSLVVKSIKH